MTVTAEAPVIAPGFFTENLAVRDPAWLARVQGVARPRPHPLFRVVPGGVEPWERVVP